MVWLSSFNTFIKVSYPLFWLLSPIPSDFLSILAVQVLTFRAVWLPGIDTVDKGFFSWKRREETFSWDFLNNFSYRYLLYIFEVTAKRKLDRLQFSTSSSFVKIWSACSCEFKAYCWTFWALYGIPLAFWSRNYWS